MLARRTLLKGLAGLPLATILADPALAQAAAETTKLVRLKTKDGREVAGALATPAASPAPTLLLIHEWWGLNDQIKAMTREFANQGYLALACDLFDGRVATTPDEAQSLTKTLNAGHAADTLSSWVDWLRNHPDGNRKVGVVGWCFGGGWSLNVSVLTPVEATAVYYGRVDLPAAKLANLKGPVLGHFGRRDKFITEPIVTAFETAMKQAGKPYTIYWYDADHAFANPTGANYDQADAQLALKRTLDFFGKELRG